MSINTNALTVTETAIIIDEAWIAPSLINSWANYGAGYENAGYYKDSQGMVHLRGLIRTGTIGTVAFVLPAGYLPSINILFTTLSNSILGRVDIDTSGNVRPNAGNSAWISLNKISFRV